jgi:hypothetical protein
MTDLGKGPQESSLLEQCTMEGAAPRAAECVITFAVTGGIFGVGRLAGRLDELSQSGRIGPWHIGPWVDWRHRAIRIKFDSVEDGKLVEHIVGLALHGAASVAPPSLLPRRWSPRFRRNRRMATPRPAAATGISERSIGLARSIARSGQATDKGSLSEPAPALVGVGRSARYNYLNPGAIMTLSARFSLLHSDLNDFLFASVGDEQNGMPLNVVSALTRLGVDPWEEAARLAALPKVLAAELLAPMLARLSISRPQRSDNVAIAQRLVELLPMRGHAAEPAGEQTSARFKKYFHAVMLLACLALGAAVFSGML